MPMHRTPPFRPTALAFGLLTALGALGQAHAQATAPAAAASQPAAATLEAVTVTAKRENRVSKGATNLPLEIKDTPQSISTIDAREMTDFGLVDSLDALRYGTGLNVEQWETNRAEYSARGFQVMLTQIDGLGMTNDWGITTSQLDTFLFDRIEIIRGANGLLTGVGNASGTVNFVRKRPTNKDGGLAVASFGSYDNVRGALDYNKVLTEDGRWAGRVVVAYEDKDSWIRALHDQRTTLYGVVDGQIGDRGVLTAGVTYVDAKQRSPMWGSLTLPYQDGSQASFPASASTSQDWTRWNTRSISAFVEYAHTISPDWEAKVTFNHRHGNDASKLFYAYTLTGHLADDNTGLIGWPYRGESNSSSNILDVNLNGRFQAFGRKHEVIAGISHSRQTTYGINYAYTSDASLVAPAFPYTGDWYPEPTWTTRTVAADGKQELTRLYAATRFSLTDTLKLIGGFNGIRLMRDGTSIYGGGTALSNDKLQKLSPYAGVTWDVTSNILAYASYSDIFQAQEQRDVNGQFVPPMKGVNAEVGVKAEWLDRKLLTTFAVFSAEQKGLATIAGFDPVAQTYYYEPKDVKSRGFEAEVTGRLPGNSSVTLGYAQLRLKGPDGADIYEWVPRKTVNLRADAPVPGYEKLRFCVAARWQSDVSKAGGAQQGAYLLADAFGSFAITDAATLRLNVRNVFDKYYLRSVQYGAIYGAPRNYGVSLELKL